MKTVTNQHIETVPEKCGGKPVIAGTRIRVWDIYVYHELQGKTADEIIAAYPHITLADVHAALAFYYDHKETIDRQMKEAENFVEELRQSTGPGPLARKLATRDDLGDTAAS